MDRKQKICECRHCGNKGFHNVLISDITTEYHDDYGPISTGTILQCPICSDLTIIDFFDPTEEESIIYPELIINEKGVPKNIFTAFCSAEKTLHVDLNICALSLRRTLELICIDKGAKSAKLVDMIEELSNTNIFPANIKEIATLMRKIGNDGAHNEIEFDKWQIKRLLKLVSIIISYLYNVPEELHFFNKEIENRNSKNTQSNSGAAGGT
ncbi:MAG: DUF4145 domain-containing protein [Firmicutes bacterium]|nr:DUF4145 domain-containing protein [Bacillota bacterium]